MAMYALRKEYTYYFRGLVRSTYFRIFLVRKSSFGIPITFGSFCNPPPLICLSIKYQDESLAETFERMLYVKKGVETLLEGNVISPFLSSSICNARRYVGVSQGSTMGDVVRKRPDNNRRVERGSGTPVPPFEMSPGKKRCQDQY